MTPPGRTKQWVFASHDQTPVGQLTDLQIGATCSTGEDQLSLPLKLNILLTNKADTTIVAPGSPLFLDMIRRAKETYELFDNADVAASTRHEEMLDLYYDYPDVQPACGRHAVTTTQPCETVETSQQLAALKLCTRLTSAHVRVEANSASPGTPTRGDLVQRLYRAVCVNELGSVCDSFRDGDCVPNASYLAESLDVNRQLLEKLLVRFGILFGAEATENPNQTEITSTADLSEALNTLNAWYASSACFIPEAEQRRDELSSATNAFWQAAQGLEPEGDEVGDEVGWVPGSLYGKLQSSMDAVPPDPDEAALDVLQNAVGETQRLGFRLDRAVLNAAYGNTMTPWGSMSTMDGFPLLQITSDALAPLAERLEGLGQFHDIGCSMTNCAAPAPPTNLSRYWRVLAHLTAGPSSDPDLGEVIGATPGDLKGWKPVFQAIQNAQVRLLSAVNQANQEGSQRARDLLAIIDQARGRMVSYDSTGFVLPAIGNRLSSGVHADQRNLVKDRLLGQSNNLAGALVEFTDRLPQLVRDLVQVREAESSRAQLEASKNRLMLEISDLAAREQGLTALVTGNGPESDNSVFEMLMEEWANIGEIVDDEAHLRTADSIDVVMTGEDSLFDGSWEGESISNFGVTKIEVPGKQTISIETEPNSVWAPNCALRNLRVIDVAEATDPGAEGQPVNFLRTAGGPITTGPEGYSITWTGSSFVAEAGTRHTERTRGGRRRDCGNGRVGLGPIPGGEGVESNRCLYVDDDDFDSGEGESWQSGSEGRTTAQFSSGLILPNTPFEAPAGALVVVEMAHPTGGPGETDPTQIRDVHLVRSPHTTIVIDEPADLWLMVNDTHCSDPDTSNELHVTVRRFESVSDEAESFLNRMAHAIGLVRDRLPGFMARGEIFPSEREEIERQAKLDAVTGPGSAQIPFEEYPLPLQDLFLKFLAREMTRLEASIRLQDIRRELAIKNAEFGAATIASRNADRVGYLVSLAPRWGVRGLRLEQLRNATTIVAHDFRYYMGPLLRLWYPSVLPQMRTSTLTQSLRNVDVDAAELDLTETLTALISGTNGVGGLAALITSADTLPPQPEDTPPNLVVLRFPKPSLLDPSCAELPSARCPRQGITDLFKWATVAQTRALWDVLTRPPDGTGTRRFTFQVSPDDVYELLGGAYFLPCTKSLPVIRRMGMAFTGYPSGNPPNTDRRVNGVLVEGAAVAFPDVSGIHMFEMPNQFWLNLASVPVIFGANDYEDVETKFNSRMQDVRGISPFTNLAFVFPESTLGAWNLLGAGSIDLLLELEATRASDVVAVSACTGGLQ